MRTVSHKNGWVRGLRQTFCLLLAVAALTPLTSRPASACGACLDCITWQNAVSSAISIHQTWFQNTFWANNFLPGMRRFTDQFTQTMMLHARMVGGFIDGQNFVRSQLAMQEMAAEAVNTYTPSESVCQFGTLSRSLAATQAKSRQVQLLMAERSQARELGKHGSSGANGPQEDLIGRLKQYQETFCDVQDNNGALKSLCLNGGPDTAHNMDIDFTRAIDTRPTLNVDFTSAGAPTADERNVLAMANNLYAHELFNRFSTDKLKDPYANQDNRTVYMDLRAVTAKRSVAEHSFNTLVAMKAAGTPASRQYVLKVLQNLGMSNTDAERFFGGAETPPSYSAQMEILTKKLYQDPAFYVNLMDKPANVQRQYAALQSFGLMQQRDVFETILRSEMLLSLIVELEVARYQDDVQNRLNTAVR